MSVAVPLDFGYYPLYPGLVLPKPENTLPIEIVNEWEALGLLIITRKRDGNTLVIGVGPYGEITLYSRTMTNVTEFFPHIVEELRQFRLPINSIIGSELIVDNNGKDSFPDVNRVTRSKLENSLKLLAEYPTSVMPYGIYASNGSILDTNNAERFDLLFDIFDGHEDSKIIKMVEILVGPVALARQTMIEKEWEGLVVYNAAGRPRLRFDGKSNLPYRDDAGKIKPLYEDDFVVERYRISTAKSHPGGVKDFELLQYLAETDELIVCGNMGNALKREQRYGLLDYKLPMVLNVAFEDRYQERKTLKNGRILAVRLDKTPKECVFYPDNYRHTPSLGKNGHVGAHIIGG